MHINQKIEFWKNRLLDLGKRNRLINCSLPKSGKRVSRAAILISKPNLEELWDIFADGDAALSFPIPIEINETDENQESFFYTNSFKNGILTNQSPAETCKTLLSLMKKAKAFTEEKGLNALYLAFGFLNWKENGAEGQVLRSPLILVPVTLSQDSINDPILLSRSDDEITVNHALELKLLNDFGLLLPHYDETDNWRTYLSRVSEMCSHLMWQVECDAAQLSLFSFLKINMYRDLEKNADKIAVHHIVRALNGEGYIGGDNYSNIGKYNHDLTEPQEVFSVIDADSSQQDAIFLAKQEESFVLQGPPGTGKSQTITNIIAELMAEGKKVLFVSEKMAALEVVYKRLKQAGLGDFCLNIHSHNAKRREVLEQLESSMKLSRNRANLQREAFNKLYQLKNVRAELNAYPHDLHTVIEPLCKTVYQVNGILSKLDGFPNVDYIQQDADKLTLDYLAKCESELVELTRIVEKSGYQQNNPWKGCSVKNVTFDYRQQFSVNSTKLISLIEQILVQLKNIRELTGAHKLLSFEGIKNLVILSNIVKAAPKLPYTWIKCDIIDSIADVDACISISKRLNAINRKIGELTDCTGGLLSAVHEIVESALGRNNANIEKCAIALNNEETKYVAIQKDTEIGSNLAEFRNKLNIYQSIKQWDNRQSELLEIFENEIVFIDAEGIMSRYVNDYRSKFGRVFKSRYRQDRNTLQRCFKSGRKLDYLDAIHYLKMITSTHSAMEEYYSKAQIVRGGRLLKQELMLQNERDLKEKEQALVTMADEHLKNLRAEFEKDCAALMQRSATVKKSLSIEVSVDSDYCDIKCKIEMALQLREELKRLEVGDEFVRKIFLREDRTLNAFIRDAEEIADWVKIVEPWLNRFIENFDRTTMTRFLNAELSDLVYAVQSCLDKYSLLEYLADYQKAEMRLRDLGIGKYLDKIKDENIAACDILPCFNKCFYRSWIDAVTPKHMSLSAFRGERQEARIRQFRDLDKSHMEISKAALIAKLISRLPNVDSPNNGEVALLRREMAKQRKLMPTRKLIAEIPNLLPALKPCIMMSPLSVSTYLGSNSYKFDTVVFDEASQVRTEDAICAIFRAKQAIIAGDSKQLPPTDFFSSSISDMGETDDEENGEINDAGAYESLLDEAAMLPPQMLRWHYRSKHEDLIAFSNTKIYDCNLVTFPSSVENSDDVGVEYVYVDGGIYDRKDKSGNKAEAAKIAELVFEHFRIFPKRSLGVIAFGEVQQTAIEEEIVRKRRDNTQYEMFFKDEIEEPFFVKNLETVQGDERDTIILSIGYAADALGKFMLNFGPISRQGGERRLNVAVTRARYNLKLVGSIMPTDIDTERVSGIGPKLLRLYIDYAINGPKAILGEPKTNDNVSFDSIFEESVFKYLVSHGYDVITQVGCSGYRIDMAIRHPKYKGRFAIGIECDGATYHSARTARERDRLRQTILEDMGWKIYRVWSTDWIKDKHTQGQRLLLAVQSAIEEYREEPREIKVSEKKVNGFIDISKKTMNEIYSERYKKIESRYAGYSANEIPEADFKDTMLRVLENGFGLDKSSLFKETAQYGYLWQRQGSTIKEKFERAYLSLIQERKIAEDDAKIKLLERITT